MKRGLAALLQPMQTDSFLSEYWPHVPLHLPGPTARFQELFDLPDLQDPVRLLSVWSAQASVVLPGKDDEFHAISVDGHSALKLHESGMSVMLTGAEKQFEVLATFLSQLKHELGLPVSTRGRCLLYVSARGQRTNTHFDANANFVLQLTGRKRWRMAPNHSIELPTVRYSLSMPGPAPELLSYQQAALPTEMPQDAEDFALLPGSLLFVPSGHWHATEAEESSISLNFTFDQVSWADLFCRQLRKILIRDRTWRELALGAQALNPAFRDGAASKAAALLPALQSVLETLRTQELLRITFRKASDTSLFIKENRVHLESQSGESIIECGSAERSIFQWIARQEGAFTEEDLLANGFGGETVISVLTTLVELHALFIQ